MEVNLVAIYNWMEDYGANKYRLDEPSYIRMMMLMSLTSKIAKSGRSTRKSIWVNIPSDYAGGEWLNIVFRGDCYDVGDVYYDIQIDGVQVLSYDSKRSEGEVLDVTEMLDWLIARVSDVLVMAKNGEYDSYISKVPYYRRRGAIRRTDYYEIVPGARERCSSRLSEDEITELLDSKGITDTYEEAMTARRFYEACAVVYKELGIEKPNGPGFHGWDDGLEEKIRYGGMTPKEWYYATADCRDDGLYEIPLDDSAFFAGWLRRKDPYYKCGYCGGHPWDIINKYSYSFSLYVEPDFESDNCKLVVVGDSAVRSTELIRTFLALRRAGYAVELGGFKVLTDRILEKDYLGVVEEVESEAFNHGYTIAGHFARDEISLLNSGDKEVVDKLIQATEWEDLNEVKLVSDLE
jgi:hypothetical protein